MSQKQLLFISLLVCISMMESIIQNVEALIGLRLHCFLRNNAVVHVRTPGPGDIRLIKICVPSFVTTKFFKIIYCRLCLPFSSYINCNICYRYISFEGTLYYKCYLLRDEPYAIPTAVDYPGLSSDSSPIQPWYVQITVLSK